MTNLEWCLRQLNILQLVVEEKHGVACFNQYAEIHLNVVNRIENELKRMAKLEAKNHALALELEEKQNELFTTSNENADLILYIEQLKKGKQ